MENLDFNAGTFGLTRPQLLNRAYDRLKASAYVLGLTIGPLSSSGVSVFGPGGKLLKQLSTQDVMEGKTL